MARAFYVSDDRPSGVYLSALNESFPQGSGWYDLPEPMDFDYGDVVFLSEDCDVIWLSMTDADGIPVIRRTYAVSY